MVHTEYTYVIKLYLGFIPYLSKHIIKYGKWIKPGEE